MVEVIASQVAGDNQGRGTIMSKMAKAFAALVWWQA
jgi:hypothetical protein